MRGLGVTEDGTKSPAIICQTLRLTPYTPKLGPLSENRVAAFLQIANAKRGRDLGGKLFSKRCRDNMEFVRLYHWNLRRSVETVMGDHLCLSMKRVRLKIKTE